MPRTWPPCDVCGNAVETKDGFLSIDHREQQAAEERIRQWDAEHSQDHPMSLEVFLERPEVAKWRWGHADCIAEGMYDIPANRFNSLGKALDWTLHMMQKDWLQHTDWIDAVRRTHKIPNA